MRRAGIGEALLLLAAAGIGCADVQQNWTASKSIWDVRATRKPAEVKDCRLITHVDSNDAQRGCGFTAQPTTEECLRYQVVSAGGDTLLIRGSVGEAYDCGKGSVAGQPTAAEAASAVTQPPAATATSTPAPPATARDTILRFVASRDAVRGCVYLDDIDAKAACPGEPAESPNGCLAARAAKAGGNTVLIDGNRAQIFACKPPL